MTDGFFMPQVVDHGVQIFMTVRGEGPGLPERIWLTDPAECRECGHMTCHFVNRWGRTTCYSCDHLAERQRKRAN